MNISASIGDAISYNDSVHATLWGFASFAEAWYSDAMQEARGGEGRHARRREIVFAVCFVESYLCEFTRDRGCGGRYDALFDYFPTDDRRGIRERWKQVLSGLSRSGVLSATPDFCRDQSWQNFVKLVKYRDGLIHAKASRPDTSALKYEEKPQPSPEDLNKLEPGWAVSVATELVRSLHRHAGIPCPTWLVDP